MRQHLSHNRLAYSVLLIGIVLSCLAFFYETMHIQEKKALYFQTEAKQVTLRIKVRMDAYRQALDAGVALFASVGPVSREQWHDFVTRLQLARNFPGIQGLGYSEVIPAQDLAAHLAHMHGQGFWQYRIHPDGDRALYSSIIYLEPFDARNQRAFGYDMLTEPTRYAAMMRAAETGETTTSGKVRLVQENLVDEQAGFLMYAPVYHSGMPLTTPAERLAAIQGFVYAPFRMKDLMQGILGDRYNDMDFAIYDDQKNAANLLLEKVSTVASAAERVQMQLSINGRTWLVEFTPLESFHDEQYSHSASVMLLLGLLLSFALFGIVLSVLQTQQRAELLANKMTQALSASEERLRFVLEATGDGVWDWNMVTDEVYYSKRWKTMLGYREDDIKGTLDEWEKRVHPDDLARAYADIQAHLTGKTATYSDEHRVLCKDGSYKWILDRGVVVAHDEQGNPLRMVGVHRDISNRKHFEDALKAERDYSNNLLKETPVLVVTINANGFCTYINPAGERISGYVTHEIVGKPWWDTLYPDAAHGQVDRMFAEVHAGRDVRDYEMTLTRKDGEKRVVVWTLFLRSDKAGQLIEATGFGYDITDRKRAEQAVLEAKQQAETANVAKSQFLANMSHEIRTPMNAVIGLSELLMDTALDDRQHDYLLKIQGASKMLLGIINDVLDYSKIEANKLTLEHKEVRLANVLTQLHALFSQAAMRKGLALAFHCQSDVPCVIMGDELRLNQVLTNLLSNALKFTQQGQVVVSLALLSKQVQRAVIRFSVTDTGIGLSDTALAKIFQPFVQADNSTTRQYGGTGLGLVISRRLVQAMGGELQVHSVPDQGSTFYFDVAVDVVSWQQCHHQSFDVLAKQADSMPLAASPAQQALLELSGLRVLLVEDNALNQEVATLTLTKVGVEVVSVNNGQEAVDAFLANPSSFSLILMDLQMPVMSGYEATAIIRQHDAAIPIIALTAAATVEDRQKVLAAGMNDYLAKPIDHDLLYQTMARWGKRVLRVPTASFSFNLRNQDAVLDVAYGLNIVSGNQALLRHLLSQLSAQLEGEFKDLDRRVEQADATAPAAIHALKGVSGNLGAMRLWKVCSRIDLLYKEVRPIPAAEVALLATELGAVKRAIAQYVSSVSETEHRPGQVAISPEALSTLLAQVKADLRAHNVISASAVLSLMSSLETMIDHPVLIRWQQLVESFDFEDALQLMESWKL